MYVLGLIGRATQDILQIPMSIHGNVAWNPHLQLKQGNLFLP
jgi:hypothetical protein